MGRLCVAEKCVEQRLQELSSKRSWSVGLLFGNVRTVGVDKNETSYKYNLHLAYVAISIHFIF